MLSGLIRPARFPQNRFEQNKKGAINAPFFLAPLLSYGPGLRRFGASVLVSALAVSMPLFATL